MRSVASAAGDFTVIDVVVTDLRVELLSLGAAIRDVRVPDRHGLQGPVHLMLPTPEDHALHDLNPHLGGTLGRYANRIAGAQFTLDGTTYRLDANNHGNTLHGGSVGFDRRVWDVLDVQDEHDEATVVFGLVSEDGDMGFPGTVRATTTYRVTPGRIAMDYAAETDAPTVISMANHGYWNLASSNSVAGHVLEVPAQRRLRNDDVGIPVDIVDVAGTPDDLRAPRLLGPVVDATGGLDSSYLVDDSRDGDPVRLMATAWDPRSGRRLRVSSDAPCVQVYTGNNLEAPFRVHQSISLEAQRLPDAPRRPEFGPCVLRPGEEYRSTTVLEFDIADPPDQPEETAP